MEQRLKQSAALRKRADADSSAQMPDPAALSPEAIRQTMNDLHVHQLELEMQNQELRKIHAELEASRALYFDFYNLSPVGFLTINRTGVIVEANLTAATLLGWDRHALVNQPLTRFIHPEDQDRHYLASKKQCKTTEPQEYDLRMQRADNTVLWVRLRSMAACRPDGAPVFRIVLSDITLRQQAEEAQLKNEARQFEQKVLQANEARFRQILEHALDAAYKRNLHTAAYEYVSPVWERLSGYTPEQIMTFPVATVFDCIHPDDAAAVEGALAQSLTDRSDKSFHLEYRFKHKDGQYRWFQDRFSVLRDADGHPVSLIGSVSDITARKQAEEVLQDQRFRLSSILGGTRVGTWEWNVQTGAVVFNEHWAKMLGYTLADLPADITTWKMFAHPDDLRQSAQLLDRHFAGELPFYDCECRMRHRDGHWIWVHDRGRIFTRTEAGEPLMMFGTHLDITERKQSEAALQESQAFNHAILNSLSAHIAVLDAAGVVIAANESWRRFALENSLEPGRQPIHTDIGVNYLQMCQSDQDAGQKASQGIQSVLAGTATHFSMEYPCHAPWAERWFTMNVTALGNNDRPGVVVAHLDITERKQIENQLVESRENYRRVFANQMIGICIVDTQTLQIVDVNDTYARLCGYSREELLAGMKITDLSIEPEATAAVIHRAQTTNGQLSVPTRYHRKKNGQTFPAEVIGEPYVRNGRQVMLGFVRDISQRQQAEEELAEIHSQLERKVLERTADLKKTNATLVMMLDYARKTEMDIQERVVANLRSNILGIVDVIKKQPLPKNTQDLVEFLETTTLHLAHPIARNLESQLLKLSAREIQVANLIRLGKSTNELMELFSISKKTVEFHRNNLRKKLGINSKKINLRTFLNAEFAE